MVWTWKRNRPQHWRRSRIWRKNNNQRRTRRKLTQETSHNRLRKTMFWKRRRLLIRETLVRRMLNQHISGKISTSVSHFWRLLRNWGMSTLLPSRHSQSQLLLVERIFSVLQWLEVVRLLPSSFLWSRDTTLRWERMATNIIWEGIIPRFSLLPPQESSLTRFSRYSRNWTSTRN